MPLHIHIERVDPDAPQNAAHAAAQPLLSSLPPSRKLLVGHLALDTATTRPGTAAAPWTLDGIVAAAKESGLETELAQLRLAGASDSRRKIGADIRGPRVVLELGPRKTARRIPTSWIGAHVCLVVPGIEFVDSKRQRASSVGPAAAAFGAIDRLCRVNPGEGDPKLGASLVAATFASVSVIIDACWWAPMLATDLAPNRVEELGICASTGLCAPDAAWTRNCALRIDDWLAQRLSLRRGGASSDVVQLGGAADFAWPKLETRSSHRPTRARAPQRAVKALWRLSASPRPNTTSGRRALAAPVEGPLAEAWTRWAEDKRLSSP